MKNTEGQQQTAVADRPPKEVDQLKEELRLARLEIRRKDEFIGITSHELRTPLTSLKTHIQLLTLNFRTYDPKKIREYLGKMDEFTDQLKDRISDLADVTRLTTGSIPYDFQPFNFQNMVTESIENIRRNTGDHKIEVRGKVGKPWYGDRGRLQQVINNLLSNAVKYSPEGGPIILELSEKTGQLVITVTDSGVGIPDDQLDHIFDRYSRLENGRHIAGLGLGLYISSEIVHKHSGTIQADSTPGKGTTIQVSLPRLN